MREDFITIAYHFVGDYSSIVGLSCITDIFGLDLYVLLFKAGWVGEFLLYTTLAALYYDTILSYSCLSISNMVSLVFSLASLGELLWAYDWVPKG